MGEKTEFEPGDRAPNDGTYMEIGEKDFPMGITSPQMVHLNKGDEFPETKNKDRKWTKKSNRGREDDSEH